MAQPAIDYAGDKRLIWVAEEWRRNSDELADWAMERLVNRRDVWSQYTVKNGEVGVVMLPIKERRAAGTDMVTLKKLKRHFAGQAVSHLIGLHSISDHSTCKWFAVDVDLHDESVSNADEIAQANLTACLTWAKRLREMSMDPCLFDSNGVGGYHLWVLLDDEYPLKEVYDFVSELRSDYEEFGLPRKPEVFPPKPAVKPDDLPYGLRLPGRHHTRAHYSRVYNFEAADGDNEWLEGGEAIEYMLALRPAPLPKGKKVRKTEAVKPAAVKPAPSAKPRVCVDLDGVLAKYEGWIGADHIGVPLPGAREFVSSLSEIADVIIFTSRCSDDPGIRGTKSSVSPGQMRIRIIDWLEEHEIPFTDVYAGRGKPLAAAFIDDRAVSCKPQSDSKAFERSLKETEALLGKKIKSKRQAPSASRKRKSPAL